MEKMQDNSDKSHEIEVSLNKIEAEEIKLPKSVTTSKGSVYSYLNNGKTQRFKTVEGETKEPQDVLVYIPQISTLKTWKNFERLPEWIKEYDNNQVMEILANDYVHNKTKMIILGDGSYKTINSNQEAARAENIFLFFVDIDTKEIEFALPVSVDPSIGSTTFDARTYKDDNDHEKYSCHIGNEVVSIEYQNTD